MVQMVELGPGKHGGLSRRRDEQDVLASSEQGHGPCPTKGVVTRNRPGRGLIIHPASIGRCEEFTYATRRAFTRLRAISLDWRHRSPFRRLQLRGWPESSLNVCRLLGGGLLPVTPRL